MSQSIVAVLDKDTHRAAGDTEPLYTKMKREGVADKRRLAEFFDHHQTLKSATVDMASATTDCYANYWTIFMTKDAMFKDDPYKVTRRVLGRKESPLTMWKGAPRFWLGYAPVQFFVGLIKQPMGPVLEKNLPGVSKTGRDLIAAGAAATMLSPIITLFENSDTKRIADVRADRPGTSLWAGIRRDWTSSRFRGVLPGGSATIVRESMFAMATRAGPDLVREKAPATVRANKQATEALAILLPAVTLSFVTHPAQAIIQRQQEQPHGQFLGPVRAFSQLHSEGGARRLWRGVGPRTFSYLLGVYTFDWVNQKLNASIDKARVVASA